MSQFQQQPIGPRPPSSRYPQQYGLESASSQSVLRKTPPSTRNIHVQSFSHGSNKNLRIGNITPKPPLVLDASCSSSVCSTPYSTASEPAASSSHFFRGIWKERKPSSSFQKQPHHYPYFSSAYAASSLSSSDSVHSKNDGMVTPAIEPPSLSLHHTGLSLLEGVTAATIAHEAAHAGFLCKLGQNIPAWKRRFFVLERPRANLYYFLSPHDTVPRGCLDLEGAHVIPVDDDGGDSAEQEAKDRDVWRLEIFWPETNKCIQLEARSQQVRDEWVQALTRNQFASVEQNLQQTQHKVSACTSRIGELERELKNYKLVEQELQASQQEAKEWKAKFQQLDAALRKLNQKLRRGSEDEPVLGATESQAIGKASKDEMNENDKLQVEESTKQSDDSLCVVSASESSSMRETSLLDASLHDELDVWNVPGMHFVGLYNMCEQLQQTVRLSQIEATQAVSDCSEAQLKVDAIEKRMEKAEKHLCKLWEENCGLRKILKQKKRERQVLVREVKTLREAAGARAVERRRPYQEEPDVMASNATDEDEEQLINELEAHVLSSIRLHERLLGSPVSGTGLSASVAPGALLEKVAIVETPPQGLASADGGHDSRSASVATTATATSASAATSNPAPDPPRRRPIASLLDENSETEDDMDNGGTSVAPSISSMDVEAASVVESRGFDNLVVRMNLGYAAPSMADDALTLTSNTSVASTPDRPNPLLQLDESSVLPHACPAAEGSTPVITKNGQATSKLHCPFADVVKSTRRTDTKLWPTQDQEELQVYHLTFYTRKIGLQFQKVPPPPARSTGLLTDALTADLRGATNRGGSKTAAELRRIAAISTWAKADMDNADDVCPVAQPVDAVIVCGFVGFDDTGTNVRPKLGAHLVAFDGVSVELGRWTFDSIRKAIQARDRPLTLSFRNDYLTTEQRAILTKAVAEVESFGQPPRKTLQYPIIQRRPSCDPSVHSALSYESGNFVNDGLTTRSHEDELSGASVRSGISSGDHYQSSIPQSFCAAKGVTASAGREKCAFRSFSETGSSVSVISSVAPLVSSLLYRNSAEPFTPDYLRRKPEFVEDTPQHQDFQSELL